jgi:hypothetical protein
MLPRRCLSTLAVAAGLLAFGAGTTQAATYSATTSTFATVLAGAVHGDTIELATGNYGTFSGTTQAVTIQAASGATPVMQFDFGSTAHGFTIDGVSGASGEILTGAHDITIRDSSFTDGLKIDGVTDANILLDHDEFLNIDAAPAGLPARVALPYTCATASGVTVQNSLFAGGDADGVQAGCALTVQDNEFRDVAEHTGTTNHTDAIQCGGGCPGGLVIRRNWIHLTSLATTQGITAYDTVSDALVEDNVVDIFRVWGIEWYSDTDSIIRHNTVVYRAPDCGWPGAPCGYIGLDHKPGDPAGSGTVIEDNIATGLSIDNGSTTGSEDYNLFEDGSGTGANDLTGSPTFAGGATPTTFAGFALTGGSTGKSAAADGSDLGARVGSLPSTPDTTIDSGPSSSTTSTSATFAFHADVSGSSFECSLDGAAFTACTSTKAYTSLALGQHAFAVRAIGPSGLIDPAPATSVWTITSGATPPTYVGESETAWTATTPKTTSSISVQAGDVLVAYGLAEDQPDPLSISGGSLTWTQRQQVNVAGYSRAYIWTATASTTTSITVTFTRTSGSGYFGGDVLVFRGSSGGIGASAKANSSGAPSLSLTTTASDSAVVVASVDWNALDGAARAWRTGAGALTETTYAWTPTLFTAYGGVHPDAGTAGAKTLGLTAPGSEKYSILAVEVKP